MLGAEVQLPELNSVNVMELELDLIGHGQSVNPQSFYLFDVVLGHLLPLAQVQAFGPVPLQLGLVVKVDQLNAPHIPKPSAYVWDILPQLVEGQLVDLVPEMDALDVLYDELVEPLAN